MIRIQHLSKQVVLIDYTFLPLIKGLHSQSISYHKETEKLRKLIYTKLFLFYGPFSTSSQFSVIWFKIF